MNTRKIFVILLLMTIVFTLGGCLESPIALSGTAQISTATPRPSITLAPITEGIALSDNSQAPAAISWPAITLIPITQGLENPVHITHANDNSQRIYIVEQAGRVRIIQRGELLPTPLLDISDRVFHQGEQGLLSAAFPPGYPSVGHFYVYYTNLEGDNLVVRFSLLLGSETQADPASERVILYFDHPEQRNHNGGQIAFGPDSYLYIGTGDGGGANDPLGNGQNPNTYLGKILRIDVESGTTPYAIPEDNPFVAIENYRDEIWGLGLRNPWRFSFDRDTADLYIADVGQNKYEEINMQPAGSPGGENYGWNTMEGLHCFRALTCDQSRLTAPIAEYSHNGGYCSVTGGHVYRGKTYPSLQGIYFFSDFCSRQIWGLQQFEGVWVLETLLGSEHVIASFGEDNAGELFLADYNTGVIYQITAQ